LFSRRALSKALGQDSVLAKEEGIRGRKGRGEKRNSQRRFYSRRHILAQAKTKRVSKKRKSLKAGEITEGILQSRSKAGF